MAAYFAQSTLCVATVRDVVSFGATPNDLTQDGSAIQKAIDAASKGDTVLIPRGTFLVNRTLLAKSGVEIRGAAAHLTILKYSGGTKAHFFDLSGTQKVELCGFTLEGNDNPNLHHGIFGHGGGGHRIHHLKIQNLASPDGPVGIHFTGDGKTGANGVTGCMIADNTISNIGLDSPWGGGIRLSWGSSNNVILRNVVDHTGRGGIFANDGCTDLVISSNRVMRSGRKAEKPGLEIWRGCDRVVLEDNQVDHWLSIWGRWVAVRRNTVRETSGDISFIGIEVGGQDVVVTDNLVDGGQQIGVSVSNNASNQWQYCGYNVIRNMVQWGAQLQGDQAGARMLYFFKNKFLSTQRGNPAAIYPGTDGRGFRFNGNCQQVTLDSNEIRDNPAQGIELGGDNLNQISVVNNIISGNGSDAVSGDPGADLEWNSNTVVGNGRNKELTSRGFAKRKPVADFDCPTKVVTGQPAVFRDASSDFGGRIEHVLWDFGDGVPTNQTQGTHVYNRAGIFRVTLVVWDNQGRAAIKERFVTVKAAPR